MYVSVYRSTANKQHHGSTNICGDSCVSSKSLAINRTPAGQIARRRDCGDNRLQV